MTDEQLALLYADGNNRAFDELLTRIQDKLFTYIIYMVKDEELANDVFQETFIKAITKLRDGKYKDNGKFSFWMTRIAHNVIIDHYRELKSSHIVETGNDNDLQNLKNASVVESDRERGMVNEQVLKDVKRLMNALPDAQREVVFMRYYHAPQLQAQSSELTPQKKRHTQFILTSAKRAYPSLRTKTTISPK